jgi:flagellar basal body-associated protein FliL
MAISDSLEPATNILGGGIGNIASYAWVFFAVVIVVVIVGAFIIFRMFRKKKTQWTHKLKIRRVIQGGQLTKGQEQKQRLSDPIYINMRRFPLIKKAEVFELESPLLGGYLLPELDTYSGENEFSIILDINNRIYTNQGEYVDFDKNCVNVSAKHSEIDIQRSNLKADFQNINKTSKRIEWAEIAKYAFMAIALVVIMIISIVGIQNWGKAQAENAKAEQGQAIAMQNLASAMTTMEGVVNTQKLEILPMMREIYKTKNIQGIINEDYNATI